MKAAVTDEAIEVLERFLILLKTASIRIERAVLFGSFARGYAHEWSDIDVALVSPDFSGIRFYDRKTLNPLMLNVDTRIETHPFRPEDFTEEDPFVEEIMRTGVELHV